MCVCVRARVCVEGEGGRRVGGVVCVASRLVP